MQKKSKKNLSLSKEIVRALEGHELKGVAGAYSGANYTCNPCAPTNLPCQTSGCGTQLHCTI